MTPLSNPVLKAGGLCGLTGTVCYILTQFVPGSPSLTYSLALAWPILSIIFSFVLFNFINERAPLLFNQLSFLFACLGFTVVACMISVQLAVRWGIEDIQPSGENRQMLLEGLRLVDYGLDVAWDILIGTSLIFLGFALRLHNLFGWMWGAPPIILALMLLVFNVYTFPHPPNASGLIDVGPAIGLFIIALSGRLILLAFKTDQSVT